MNIEDNNSELSKGGCNEAICFTCEKMGQLSTVSPNYVDNNQETGKPNDSHFIESHLNEYTDTANVISMKSTTKDSRPKKRIAVKPSTSKAPPPIPKGKKIPILPKFRKPLTPSTIKKICTTKKADCVGISSRDDEISSSLKEPESSLCSSLSQTDDQKFMEHSFDGAMSAHDDPSLLVSRKRDLVKKEVNVSGTEVNMNEITVGPSSNQNKLRLSNGDTHILTAASSSSLSSDANPPHSRNKPKVLVLPRFKSSRSAEDIPYYTNVKKKPTNNSESISTSTNVAYLGFNCLSKGNSKSLERFGSYSDISQTRTTRSNYKRHSLFEDSLEYYVDIGAPIPPNVQESRRPETVLPKVKPTFKKQKKKGPPVPPRTFVESSNEMSYVPMKSHRIIRPSLQSLDPSGSMTAEQKDEEQEDYPSLSEIQIARESFTHTYEVFGETIAICQDEESSLSLGRSTPQPWMESTLSSDSSVEATSPVDDSSFTNIAGSVLSSVSSLKMNTSLMRSRGARISVMLSKLNKKVQNNTRKMATTTFDHFTAVTNPISSRQSRRQRTYIEKYRFPGELGFGIRPEHKPKGPREEPSHWKSIEIRVDNHIIYSHT